MSDLKTVIFVDGQNFRKNLQAFAFHSDPPHPSGRSFKLDEKHFFWGAFFQDVVRKFNSATGFTHRLVRVYWYNAADITPYRPYRKGIQKVLERYREEFSELNEESVEQLARDWHETERRTFQRGKEDVYEAIQRQTDFLEFKYVGQYVVQPFRVYRIARNEQGEIIYKGTRVGERGVDLGIAIDMVAKMPYYDAAVLVSGDADFLPAVKYLKDGLKQVYQFSVAQGIPPQIRYLSPWLRGFVDVFGYFNERELLESYVNRRAVPDTICDVIDKRIECLKQGAPARPEDYYTSYETGPSLPLATSVPPVFQRQGDPLSVEESRSVPNE
jgi:uncharacterized LabA/DUF88 family protein